MLSPSLNTIRLFLHVFAASIWVGGQIVLGALVPKLRQVSPDATKAAARGFATVAWPAYAVVILTGFWNLAEIDVANTSTSYQITIFVKIVLAVATGAAAAVHSAANSRLVMAVGGAVGLLAAIGAMFVGYLLTSGT
jgi:putative copper export protein